MPSIDVRFENLNKVTNRLNWVAGKVERGANRDALTKASKPMLKASKRNARAIEKTGTLRKSLKRKVRTNVRKGLVQVLVGPDRRVVAKAYGGTHIPANIVHLIEFGFNHYGGKHVPGKEFLKISFDETKQEAIRIYKDEIGYSIEKFVKKFSGKV